MNKQKLKSMSNINIMSDNKVLKSKAKELGFKGQIFRNEKYTNTYRKFLRENPESPLLEGDFYFKGKIRKVSDYSDKRSKNKTVLKKSVKKQVDNFREEKSLNIFNIKKETYNAEYKIEKYDLTFKNEKKTYTDIKIRNAIQKLYPTLGKNNSKFRIIFTKDDKTFSTSVLSKLSTNKMTEAQQQATEDSKIPDKLEGSNITLFVYNTPEGGSCIKPPKWLEGSKSMYFIINDDNLCGQRCFVAYTSSFETKKKLNKRKDGFTKKAVKVAKEIGIEGKMSFTDFDKITECYNTRVVIFGGKNQIIYDTQSDLEFEKRNNENIMYIYWDMTISHYHLITNTDSFNSKSDTNGFKWCNACQKVYPYDVYNFHNCIGNKCYCCGSFDKCKKEEWVQCFECAKFCVSESCLEKHMKTFHTYKIGEKKGTHKCGNFWFGCKCKARLDKERFNLGLHKCGEMKCTNCDEYHMKKDNHKCNIIKPKKTDKSKGDNHTYYCFDFESKFDDENTHIVNLVKVGKIGDESFMMTFFNINKFISWATTLKKSTLIAHNLKGYDGWLIHHHLRTEFGTKPDKIVLAGQKVMYLEFKKVRFIDSLNFVQSSLSALPKTFGLDTNIVKKGFFPYLMNTDKNKNYYGKFPPIEIFEPNRMKCRKEFDIWYNENKDRTDYDFNRDLNEYCENDVLVLCKSLEVFRDSMKSLCEDIDPLQSITIASYCHKVYLTLHAPTEEEIEKREAVETDKVQSAISILSKNEFDTIKRGFGGGRTEVFQLYKKWTNSKGELKEEGKYGKYVDIVSLYPTVQFLDYLPYGKPKHITEFNDCDISKYFGTIRCDITPPKDLLIPLLGGKSNGKFCFGLNDMIDKVYNSVELQKAVSIGYKITKIYEVFHFKKTKELFKSYIRTFMKGKIIGGGHSGTYEEKIEFCNNYKEKFGIDVKPEELKKNPGLKAVSKLCLNSLWGKFAMRQMKTSEYITDTSKWFKLLKRNNDDEITLSIKSVQDLGDSVFVEYQENKEEKTSLTKTNIALASFTTSQARLRLYEELEKLKERVVYCDTDSIIYEYQENNYNVKTGKMLGDWEAEGKEDHKMVEFSGIAPKAYSYILEDGYTDVKSKGVSLTVENKELITLNAYKELIDSKVSIKSNMMDFKKNKDGMKTIHTHKDISFDDNKFKRNIIDNYQTLPIGYVN